MENKDDRLVAFCIAIFFFLSFLLGIALGAHCMKDECDKWEEMYDRHINEQWQMMQRKDSMYAEYFKLRIEYMDGHIVEPKK